MGTNTAARTHKLARLPLVALAQATSSVAVLFGKGFLVHTMKA
jgi:hypothetical protein